MTTTYPLSAAFFAASNAPILENFFDSLLLSHDTAPFPLPPSAGLANQRTRTTARDSW